MILAEYAITMMKLYPENWHEDVDENGETIIVNKHGEILKGVEEPDGTVTSAKELITMLNERKD